jgi:putative transposase
VHVLNRANGRLRLFRTDADYAAFLAVLAEAVRRFDVRLLAFCLMPNHWHLVLWPRTDGAVSAFMRWLTVTHANRWHAHHHTPGSGHLYQGRFKSFLIEADRHLLIVWRYVERNAVRAGLARRARQWRWGSLWLRAAGDARLRAMLSEGPVELPRGWERLVDEPQTEKELEALRRSLRRGRPFGGDAWVKRTASALGLESTTRPRGRPRKPAMTKPKKGS